MRKDMSKVIVERPRANHKRGEDASRHIRRETRQMIRLNGDDLDADGPGGGRESMKSHLRGNAKRQNHRKELNENLSPLYRFLESKVDRPWNDVFSEICANINTNSAVQMHIRQHLDHMVETNIKMVNGKPWYFVGRAYGWDRDDDGFRELLSTDGWPHYYVNPENGKLERAPYHRYRSLDREDFFYVQDPKDKLTQWHVIDGIWYEIKFRLPTEEEKAKKDWGYWGLTATGREWIPTYFCKFMVIKPVWRARRGYSHFDGCEKQFGRIMFPVSKRQISSREIKRAKSLIGTKFAKKQAA